MPSTPTIAKVFGTATLSVGGTTALTFTLVNLNATNLTAVAFSDTLPTGLVVATPNGLVNASGLTTISAVAGTGVVSLTGATLVPGTHQISVNILASTAGVKSNVSGAVSSTEGGAGTTATASLTVLALVIQPLWRLLRFELRPRAEERA